MNMKSKLFRRPTALSRGAHLSPEGHLSSRAAALSALLLLFALPAHAQTPNLSLCEGQNFMLTSDADGPDELGQLTYTWKEGVPPQVPGTVTAVPSLTVTGKPAGTYAYVCEVANSACTLSTSSYTVEVLPAPAAPTLTQNGPKCVGTAITFTASGGSGAYEWSCTGFTCSGTGATQTTPTTADTYTARVRTVNTIGSTSCYSAYAPLTGSVLLSPGTASWAPSACGCADGLFERQGYCFIGDSDACQFHMGMNYDRFSIIDTFANDNPTYVKAYNYCSNLGMRLPTQHEAYCICKGYPNYAFSASYAYYWYQCDPNETAPCSPACTMRSNCTNGRVVDKYQGYVCLK
jgi:hypothetical protein